MAAAGVRQSRLGQASSHLLPTISSLELWKCRNALGHAFPLQPLQAGAFPLKPLVLVGRGATVTCSTQSSWIKSFLSYLFLTYCEKALQGE